MSDVYLEMSNKSLLIMPLIGGPTKMFQFLPDHRLWWHKNEQIVHCRNSFKTLKTNAFQTKDHVTPGNISNRNSGLTRGFLGHPHLSPSTLPRAILLPSWFFRNQAPFRAVVVPETTKHFSCCNFSHVYSNEAYDEHPISS